MPMPKTVWVSEDGTEFDTETEAAAYEQKAKMKKDVPLAIRYAMHMARLSGSKLTPYSDTTIAGFANMLAFLRLRLGDALLVQIVTGNLEPDTRRQMQNTINPPKPAKVSPAVSMILSENGGQDDNQGDDDDE